MVDSKDGDRDVGGVALLIDLVLVVSGVFGVVVAVLVCLLVGPSLDADVAVARILSLEANDGDREGDEDDEDDEEAGSIFLLVECRGSLMFTAPTADELTIVRKYCKSLGDFLVGSMSWES